MERMSDVMEEIYDFPKCMIYNEFYLVFCKAFKFGLVKEKLGK